MLRYLLYIYWLASFLNPASCFITRQTSNTKKLQPARVYSVQDGFSDAGKHRKHRFSQKLVDDLDLTSIFEGIAAHAVTRRGYDAILDLVSSDDPPSKLRTSRPSARNQIIRDSSFASGGTRKSAMRLSIADSAVEAERMYKIVEEAGMLLDENESALVLPPFYGEGITPFQTRDIPETDDDEWLDETLENWDLKTVAEAEQLTKMLLELHDWSQQESIQKHVPHLSEIGAKVNRRVLSSLYEVISGTVEISRARTVLDPWAKSSFSFALSETKFPVLKVLRDRRESLSEKSKGGALGELKEEILLKEEEILHGLFGSIQAAAHAVDDGLNLASELDVLIAKVAYGSVTSGVIPIVQSNGMLDVRGFVHPILSGVPLDILLPSANGQRGLVISGPNGGGKTIAMKSFAIVAVLARVGIPISADPNCRPRVDFFHDILTCVGDQQNLLKEQSTYMANLNSYADIIEKVSKADKGTNMLVLLDEVGSGTDSLGGGAIGQAVLERLVESSSCRLIATTHSLQVKTLSFESDMFECASMLHSPMKSDEGGSDTSIREPTFILQYGVVGESHALSAAQRSQPALPLSVLQRARDIALSTDDESNIRILEKSLEKHQNLVESHLAMVRTQENEAMEIRRAMLALADSYGRRLGQLENRVENCYNEMKESEEPLELLGNTLSELRTARAQVKSQAELLREQGLRIVPSSYELKTGDSVVIVKEEWAGVSATVAETEQLLSPTEIAVIPSFSPWEDPLFQEPAAENIVVLERHHIAFWDDSPTVEFDASGSSSSSVRSSKRRLDTLLSGMKSGVDTSRSSDRVVKRVDKQVSFNSSRERKAAKKSGRRKKRR